MSLPINTTLVSRYFTANTPVPGLSVFSGLFAVIIFSLTAPLTTIALEAFSPAFIACMRAMIAGALSIAAVLWFKWPMPKGRDLVWLSVGGAGIALIFPFSLAQSLLNWQASEIGIVLAGLPFVTALIAVGLFKEKTTKQFWMSLLVGSMLLVLFAYSQSNGVLYPSLFLMLLAAGFGYAMGGHVAKRLGGFQTICWMMVLYFPISLFGTGYFAMENAASFTSANAQALLALVYLAVMSQWIGFHFWYESMVNIGIAKTGQLQLLQPFFTLGFAVPLLGYTLTLSHVTFAVLITGSVWLLRRSQ
ncbi:MAG: DMT family transporter [Bermanella sp.]